MPAHFQTLLEISFVNRSAPFSQLSIISEEESVRLSNDFNAAL